MFLWGYRNLAPAEIHLIFRGDGRSCTSLAEIPLGLRLLRAQAPRWAPIVVGKSRQMSSLEDLVWDLCCEVNTRRESARSQDARFTQVSAPRKVKTYSCISIIGCRLLEYKDAELLP